VVPPPQTVEFYRQQHPDRFLPHEKLAQKENGTVFRVGFMPRQKLRSIVNLGDALQVPSALLALR
jgi:hypothetical protein